MKHIPHLPHYPGSALLNGYRDTVQTTSSYLRNKRPTDGYLEETLLLAVEDDIASRISQITLAHTPEQVGEVPPVPGAFRRESVIHESTATKVLPCSKDTS